MSYYQTEKIDESIFYMGKNLGLISKKNYENYLDFIIKHRLFMDMYPRIRNNIKKMEKYAYYESLYKKNKKKLEMKLKFYVELQNLFEKNNIEFTFLKAEKYPNLGKDIDILVKSHFDKALKILEKNGWIPIKKFHYDLFNRHILINNKDSIKLDLYYEYSRFHERWFKDSSNIIENKRLELIGGNKLYCPSIEDSFIIHLIGSFYLNGSIDLCTIKTLVKLYNSISTKNKIFIKCKSLGVLEGLKLFFYSVDHILDKNLLDELIKLSDRKQIKKKYRFHELIITKNEFQLNPKNHLHIFVEKIKKEFFEYNFLNFLLLVGICSTTHSIKILKFILR